MDPALIVFAIQALVRLAREGKSAYDQYQRDRDIFLPQLKLPAFQPIDLIRQIFLFGAGKPLVAEGGPLTRFWNDGDPNPLVPGAFDVLYLEATRVQAEQIARNGQVLPAWGTEVAGAVLIRQWREGSEPVGPLARMALALADVGLEFVGTNASVLGIGGNGEKLVAAIAGNLADLIPDDAADFGPRSQLTERLLGIFLRAGLKAINDKPDLVVGKEHLQKLISEALPPIVEALPETLAEQARWRDVGDALIGPAAEAAMRTIADNPRSFLGANFAPQKAMGALTQALLQEASTKDLRQNFSEAGLISLYRAGLGVAADHPELFVGHADSKALDVAKGLIGGVAAKLKSAPVPFNGDIGIEVATVVLEAVKQYGPTFLDPDTPWEDLAADIVVQVADGFGSSLASSGGPNLLSHAQILELVRTLVDGVGRTPAMVAGGNRELQTLVATVAQAIVRDSDLVLSAADWLQVAATLGEEVASNPQRLLKMLDVEAGVPTMTLATALISDLVAVAAAEKRAGGRKSGGVLFGATLEQAIGIALGAASSKVDDAIAHRAALRALAEAVSNLVRDNPGRYGSEEWLALFGGLIDDVLGSGQVTDLSEAVVKELLEGGKG